MDEILMFIGISKSKKEVRLLDERLKSKVFKYKNKKDLEDKLIKFVKQDLDRNKVVSTISSLISFVKENNRIPL